VRCETRLTKRDAAAELYDAVVHTVGKAIAVDIRQAVDLVRAVLSIRIGILCAFRMTICHKQRLAIVRRGLLETVSVDIENTRACRGDSAKIVVGEGLGIERS
jgi:hypothetical protein